MISPEARNVLKRIVPWALEANATKSEHRSNYKGIRGRIGIVGGARDYAGAPYFASIAAMRLGADLSYVICSKTAAQSIKNYSPDLIVVPLLDCPSETEFASEMDCLLNRLHALVVGPGLSRDKTVQSRAKQLIEEAKTRSMPLVLDADSLVLVNEDPALIKSYSKVLLTPNRVELQRMLDSLYAPRTFDLRKMPTSEIEKLVIQCSNDLNVSILAKGMVDIIFGSSSISSKLMMTDERLGSNRRCGGQGDILSGLSAVFLHWIEQANVGAAQKGEDYIEHPSVWAAYLAAIITRHSNELAFKEHRYGMLASHMLDKIQASLSLLLDESKVVNYNSELNRQLAQTKPVEVRNGGSIRNTEYVGKMSHDEISRYTRQMIMEEFGPERQLNLKKASAIIIGAGGLGCPSAVYLGAGGIGRLGLVDDDVVEASNLHRQILHNLAKVGMLKTDSIKEAILSINPNVVIDTYSVKMTRQNAVQLIENYDIVIDATDNLLTRYMISDACVVAKKPLVSGAALKMDGQLTVYNYDDETPCFRCLFPDPPPPSAVGSCSDNGVLGVIPGIIGVQQALEAIKIGAGLRPAYAGKMLLYDGQLGLFRHITLGKRKPNCEACGKGSKLGRDLINYDEFCGEISCRPIAAAGNDILDARERVTVEEYRAILESGEPHVLVDVRPIAHSDISRFAHALPIPVVQLMNEPSASWKRISDELKSRACNTIYVVCRRGIASQRGTRIIQDLLQSNNQLERVVVKDIIGGMTAWAKRVDPTRYSCL